MRYRILGGTGVEVSSIGFGASPLGGVFGEVSVEGAIAAVHHAIDAGINLFDVSPFYGKTLAEQRLGMGLAGRRQEVILATKCGRYGEDHFDFSAGTIVREFEQSLRRLKTDHVDLLQVHDLEFGDIEQIVNETIPAMHRLREHGKIRFVGITGYWPGLLAEVAARAPVDTVLSYCHFNLMMDDMDDCLTPFARESHLGLLNASPMHMGLLIGGAIPDWHPAPARVRAAAAEVVRLCREHGADPAAMALRFCLDHPDVASTLVGIASIEQIDGNLKALDLPPQPDLMEAICDAVAPVFNTVWPSGRIENWDATLRSTDKASADTVRTPVAAGRT